MEGDNVEVQLLGSDRADLLERVVPGVFDHEVNQLWAREFLDDPRHHMAVAVSGDTVVGMASALHYIHPDKPPELWINELGVAKPYRGQGVGRQLVEALLSRGRAVGCRSGWVLTDADNEQAIRLFERLGGEPGADAPVMIEFRIE